MTTLHGSMRPISGSALRARCASLGLHAPRIRYGRNSSPSFSLGAFLVDDHVAWEHEADIRLRAQSSMCQFGIARTQDQIRAELFTQFLLKGLLHVDFSHDAETLLLQGLSGQFLCLLVADGHVSGYAVCRIAHTQSLHLFGNKSIPHRVSANCILAGSG